MLLATLGTSLVLAAPAQAVTVPYQPGAPQAGTPIYEENLSNVSAAGAPIQLPAYVGGPEAQNSTYTASAPWLPYGPTTGKCNGWIMQKGTPLPSPDDGCNRNNGWSILQDMATAVGLYQGMSTPQAEDNQVLTAYTNNSLGTQAAGVQFETTTATIPVVPGNFYAISAIFAQTNCFSNHASETFELIVNGTPVVLGSGLDPCTDASRIEYNINAALFSVAELQSNSFRMPAGVTSVGIRISNQMANGNGNDVAFDLPRIVDVTPQLDKEFSPTTIVQGGTSTLTHTITNTDELVAKTNWTFTDNLPNNVKIANPPAVTTTCLGATGAAGTSAAVTAAAGGTSLTANGSLGGGQASCTVSVNVTSDTVGTYTNRGCADAAGAPIPGCVTNYPTMSGLNPPGATTLTVTPVGGPISTFTGPACLNGTASLLARWQGSGVGTSPVSAPGPRIDLNTTMSGYPAGSIHMDWASVTSEPGATASYDLFTPSGAGLAAQYAVPSMELRTSAGGPNSTHVVDITFPAPTSIYFPILDVDTWESGSIEGFNGATAVAGSVTARSGAGGLAVTQAGTVSNVTTSTSGTNYPDNDVRGMLDVTFANPVTRVRITDNLDIGTNEIGDIWGCQSQDLVKSATAPTVVSTTATTATYHTDLTFTVGNTQGPGEMRIYGPQVTDSLASALGGTPAYSAATVTGINVTGPAPACTANTGYDGVGNNTMLTGNASAFLAAGESCVITVGVDVTYPLSAAGFTKNNTATATGAGTNPTITDGSTNGTTLPPTPKGDTPSPTPLTFPPTTASIELVKQADREVYVEGDTITYLFVATNTGGTDLTGVMITDPLPGLSTLNCSPAAGSTLAPGDSMTCTATKVASAADVAAGEIPNTATVTATTFSGSTIDDSADELVVAAGYDIVKYTNGQDANAAPGPYVAPGDAVTWTYVVTNTGSAPIMNVDVTDDQGVTVPSTPSSGDTNSDGILDPDEVWTFTATGTATAGQYANVGTVNGDIDDDGDPATPAVPLAPQEDPSHYFGAEPGFSIVKSTNGQDANTAPGPYIAPGDPVLWTYVVTNTGNVAISNVVVTDDQGVTVPSTPMTGDIDADGVLDVGEVWTFMAAGTATVGQYRNVGTVNGDIDDDGDPTTPDVALDPEDDPSHYFGAVAGFSIVKSTNGEDANSAPGPYIPVGDPVLWTYVVTNTGSTPISNVVVTDDQGVTVPSIPSSGDTDVDGVLDVGEVWTFVATGVATAGQYENVGTVNGVADADGDPSTPPTPVAEQEDPSHYFGSDPGFAIVKSTNGDDANAAPGPFVAVGDPVTWTYVVTNTGNRAISNVVVTDDQGVTVPVTPSSGDIDGDGVLDAGEVWTFEATGVATAGQYGNVGTVTGDVDDDGDPSTPEVPLDPVEDPSHYFGTDPGFSIVKSTNGDDANVAPGVVVAPGDAVTWTYVVTNTGNLPISNVVVTDDQGVTVPPTPDSGDTNSDGILDPGEVWTFTATGTATAGQYTNVGMVTGGIDDDGDPQSPEVPIDPVEDPSNYFGADPGFSIVKSTNGDDANAAPGPFVAPGDTVTWTYEVTNTGNVPVSNVVVTDDQGVTVPSTPSSGDTDADGVLDVGEVWTFEATGTAVAGQYANVGTVTGDIDDDLNPSTPAVPLDPETDPSHYFGADPGFSIVKSTNGQDANSAPGPFVAPGDPVLWTYVVTNTGNVEITNVVVTDDQGVTVPSTPSSGDTDGDGVLDVGETWTFAAMGTATAGQYANVGTVTGDVDDDGDPQTPVVPLEPEDDPSHYFGGNPAVTIVKSTNGEDANSAPGPFVAPGDPIMWTYVVSNTGNQPVSNVVVTDDQGVTVPSTPSSGDTDGDGVLDVGETWTFAALGTATAGQYANVGTVNGTIDDDGDPSTPEVPIDPVEDPSHYFGAEPGFSIVKSTNGDDANAAPGPFVAPGDAVTWTYEVTNTGNVPVSNVVVTDDQGVAVPSTPSSGDADSDGVLDAGEVWTFTATGTATAGQYGNVGTVNGDIDDDGDPSTPLVPLAPDDDPSHYFGADPSVSIVKSTNGLDANTAPGVVVAPGDPVTWTYVVTNTGNVPVNNVVVTDDQGVAVPPSPTSGDTDADGVLDVGEVWTFTATGTAVAGQYTNVGTVTGDVDDDNDPTTPEVPIDPVEDPSNYFAPAPGFSIVKSTNGDDANTAPGPYVTPGDTVTWTYVVSNTGNVPVSNVVVTDDQGVAVPSTPTSGDVDADGVLGVGEVWTFTATGVATAGQYANLGTVTGDIDDDLDPSTPTVPLDPQEDPSHYFGGESGFEIEKYTNGEDADVAPGPYLAPGDDVTWTYVVTNTGNLPVSNVVVTDDQGVTVPATPTSGDTNGDGILDLDEVWTFTATGTAVAGQYANVGTVTGDVDDDNDPTTPAVALDPQDDPSHYFGIAPGYSILKSTNGEDANTAPGAVVAPGDPITWTYEVTNTGNVPVSNVVVTDDQGVAVPAAPSSGDTDFDGVLDVGEMWTFTATGTAVAGQYTNVGTVNGTIDDDGDPSTPEVPLDPVDDPSNYFAVGPGVTIIKYTNGEDANSAPGPVVAVGDTVTWTYVVTNTGNVPVSNVVVTDDQGVTVPATPTSGDTNGDGVLDLDEVWTFTATGTATAGQYANIGTVTGSIDDDLDPETPSVPIAPVEDPSHYFGADPGIAIDKDLVGAPLANGDGTYTVTYDLVVTNTGNVDTTFTLEDTPRYGDGLSIESAAVAAVDPADASVNPDWNGDADTVVVTDQAIGVDETFTYRVVVTAAVATDLTLASGDCTLVAGEDGTGFLNEAIVSIDGLEVTDDACAPAPMVTIAKDLVGAPVANGDGTFTLTYDVTVVNPSEADTSYDLDDEVAFGDGIAVDSATVANTDPGSIVTSSTWDGTADTRIVTGEAIAAGATHTYRVVVVASAGSTLTTEASDCTSATGETGTGFLNTATVTHNGAALEDEACAPAPRITIDKQLVGSPVDEGDGTYTITYVISVANPSEADTSYDLDDKLAFGAGIAVDSATVANTDPGSIVTSSTWDGAADARIVSGVAIAAGATHTYEVKVTATVPSTVTTAAADCTLTSTETGTGFLNTAVVTHNGVTTEDHACGQTTDPDISVDKQVVGTPEPAGNGRTKVTYEVVVTNDGGPGTYDLDDELAFGAGITVEAATVANTDPGSIVTSSTWDGTADTRIVTDEAIGAHTEHTYLVVVEATVATTMTSAASDCSVTTEEAGTGFLNGATVTVNGVEVDDDACAPAANLSIDKEVVGEPVEAGNGTWTIDYRITVANTGNGDTTYDLADELRFGAGIEVTSASVANATPGTITTDPTWDGLDQTTIVSDEAIEAGTTHTYRVTVQVDVPTTASATDRDCTLGDGEAGTGFLNEAVLTTNGTERTDAACRATEPTKVEDTTEHPPSNPPSTGTGTIVRTGAEIVTWGLIGAGLVVIGGMFLFGRRRRYQH